MNGTVLYRLGAEELLELGSTGKPKPFLADRRPFFSREGRSRAVPGHRSLGQMDLLTQVGAFLAKFLSEDFSVLARIVNIPANILSSDVNLLATSVSALIEEVPTLGTVAAQIFRIANPILRFGLTVPGELRDSISNVVEGIGQVLDSLAPAQRALAAKNAMDKIMDRTPSALKEAVSAVLSGRRAPPSGALSGGGQPGAMIPPAAGASSGADGAGGLETALTVGIAAGGMLLLLVT